MDWLALAVFLIVVGAIVSRILDDAVIALAGLIGMIVLIDEYTPWEAFDYIDWNVLAILYGMWVITAYMVEAGLPRMLINYIAGRVRSYRGFLVAAAVLSGFLSMLVDNVLVILLFGSLVLEAARRSGKDPFMPVLLIALSANFMGTALLLGDLPPQLLHSVAGAEFMDFIWFHGKPSSFPLLTITFLLTLAVMYVLFINREEGSLADLVENAGIQPSFTLWASIFYFFATVILMALRPLLGVPLGFIPLSMAALLTLTVEAYRSLAGGDAPSFEDILKNRIEWRALLFYASLFGLVGGLEDTGVVEEIASRMSWAIEAGTFTAYTVFYWVVAVLSLVVEHDALLLTFLYIVRDLAAATGINPWPLYWGMAWSATLASNATTAAAPALYVAVTIVESSGRRVRASEFLRYSLTFALISLVIHYIITILLFV